MGSLLASVAQRFRLLPYGVAPVLMSIGAKMLVTGVCKVPVARSLGVVAATIGTVIALGALSPPGPPPG